MALIKIEAVIEVDENHFPLDNKDEQEWFIDLMNDKKNTHILLWNNDLGDEIGHTFNFKWEQLWDIQQ